MAKDEGKLKADDKGSDWMEEFFKSRGITEDDDKSFLRSRALADEFVEEARKQRAPKSENKPAKKGMFGGRASQD